MQSVLVALPLSGPADSLGLMFNVPSFADAHRVTQLLTDNKFHWTDANANFKEKYAGYLQCVFMCSYMTSSNVACLYSDYGDRLVLFFRNPLTLFTGSGWRKVRCGMFERFPQSLKSDMAIAGKKLEVFVHPRSKSSSNKKTTRSTTVHDL